MRGWELILEKEKKALAEKDIENYLLANKAFHLGLVMKSQNQFLIQFIEKLIDMTNIYIIFYDNLFGKWDKPASSPEEHKKILTLIEQKNVQGLEQMLFEHNRRTYEKLNVTRCEFGIR